MRRAFVAFALLAMLSMPATAQTPQPSAQGGAPVVRTNERVRTIGFIGIIVIAVVYMRLSETAPRPPRSLVQFGKRDEEE